MADELAVENYLMNGLACIIFIGTEAYILLKLVFSLSPASMSAEYQTNIVRRLYEFFP